MTNCRQGEFCHLGFFAKGLLSHKLEQIFKFLQTLRVVLQGLEMFLGHDLE